MRNHVTALGIGLMIALPHAAHAQTVTPPPVPAGLEVPAPNEAFLVGHAFGTQNYVCQPAKSLGQVVWTLFTPEATLFNEQRDQLITHFFSPNPAEGGVAIVGGCCETGPAHIAALRDRLDEAGWAVDREAVYGVTDEGVAALALENGKVLWERPLPGGRWQVRRAGEYLLAWPSGSRGLRFQFRWPFGSLQCTGGPVDPVPFPVLCLDARTGELVQRLNFDAGPARWRTSLG